MDGQSSFQGCLDAASRKNGQAAHTKFLYAVVNPSSMTAGDLDAVMRYLDSITDAEVIVADASGFASAPKLYDALRSDARRRGIIPAGIQLFGTPDMVPAFSIQYKVQMTAGVDDMGVLCTDLFFGNFQNDPAMLGQGYSVKEHLANRWEIDLIPHWPVTRLPLRPGDYPPFMQKYEAFARQTGLKQLEKVLFYNPIFPLRSPVDDMARFFSRMRREMHFTSLQYRVYGNRKGDYPVSASVLGDFSAENMALENEKGIWEYLIASHGQQDNIDACYFENREEKRLSTLSMQNISDVLGKNPYYLDTWTCLNGCGMKDNLTTAALSGQCVGMFSATAILSNNGVDWRVPLSQMSKSNFYYFYYHYLKALHGGACRSQAFFAAQREYAIALAEDAKSPLRGEGNVQYNLYNLLAYHNFGLIEPHAHSKRAPQLLSLRPKEAIMKQKSKGGAGS